MGRDAREKTRRTEHLMALVESRRNELDVRAAIAAVTDTGTADHEGHAYATGIRLLADVTDAYGLHAETVLERVQRRATLQVEAMLAALGVTVNGDGRVLVDGVCIAGILTGIRIGLLMVELERDL